MNIRHELIPEVCKELMELYAGHQVLVEQDRVDRPPRREGRDQRPWDEPVSKQEKKKLQQLAKPQKQPDLSKADERSRREKEKNAKLFQQQLQGGHDDEVPRAGEAG